jgi:hypothetical protein
MCERKVLGTADIQRYRAARDCGFVANGWVPRKGMRGDQMGDLSLMKCDIFWIKSGDDIWMERLSGNGHGTDILTILFILFNVAELGHNSHGSTGLDPV